MTGHSDDLEVALAALRRAVDDRRRIRATGEADGYAVATSDDEDLDEATPVPSPDVFSPPTPVPAVARIGWFARLFGG